MRKQLNFFLEIVDINKKKPHEINLILGSIYEYSRILNTLKDLEEELKFHLWLILIALPMMIKLHFITICQMLGLIKK